MAGFREGWRLASIWPVRPALAGPGRAFKRCGIRGPCNTGGRCLLGDLSAVNNLALDCGGAISVALCLHGLDNVVAIDHLTKHSVVAIEPRSRGDRDEELGPIRVRARVGHAELARLGVGNQKVLIRELVAVDRLASGTVVVCEVT